MTYQSIKDLPVTLKQMLPNEEAQQLYVEAFNKSWNSFAEDSVLGQQDRQSTAHRDGWAAVKKEFTQDSNGVWYRRGEAPEEETQKEEGIVDKIKDVF